MTNVSKFRIAALAMIVGGSAHVSRAEAAPVAAFDSCSDFAHGYAAGFCAAMGETSEGVKFTCNADGTVTIQKVLCSRQVAPPP
jgi:hypothetical protein